MTIADSRVVEEACRECGMPCTPTEYHPYAACLMFRGCHNSKVVRENLRPLSLLAEAEELAERNRNHWHTMKAERDALQSRLDAVVGLADALIERASQHASSSELCADPINKEWHSGMSEGIDDCANEIRSAALGGESPGNDEELK